MSERTVRTGDADRDFDNWLSRLAAQLTDAIIATVFDGAEKDAGEEDTDRDTD